MIDLGQWLTESYSVPAEKLTPDEIDSLEKLQNEEENHHDNKENEQKDEDEFQ
jgi:endogenous inhibitor of DNA gyrase (YacG/DUF329 family)